MKLDDFIDKIFKRYVCNADIDEKKEEYGDALIHLAGKIDFQKLLEVVSKNNKKDFIPSVSEVLEWSKSCYKTEFKKSANGWIHVKVFNPIYNCVTNTDCFPAGTSESAILNSYKKMFPNTDGWRIVEVY